MQTQSKISSLPCKDQTDKIKQMGVTYSWKVWKWEDKENMHLHSPDMFTTRWFQVGYCTLEQCETYIMKPKLRSGHSNSFVNLSQVSSSLWWRFKWVYAHLCLGCKPCQTLWFWMPDQETSVSEWVSLRVWINLNWLTYVKVLFCPKSANRLKENKKRQRFM